MKRAILGWLVALAVASTPLGAQGQHTVWCQLFCHPAYMRDGVMGAPVQDYVAIPVGVASAFALAPVLGVMPKPLRSLNTPAGRLGLIAFGGLLDRQFNARYREGTAFDVEFGAAVFEIGKFTLRLLRHDRDPWR